jgi:hypothetical protein
MPEILRQYGQAALVAVTIALLAALLAAGPGGGVLSNIGAQASTQIQDTGQSGGAAAASFDKHATRALPTAQAKGHITERTTFPLTDQFLITDADGAIWQRKGDDAGEFLFEDGTGNGGRVSVAGITAPDGTELIDDPSALVNTSRLLYDPASDYALFRQAGIYRVRLRIVDHDNVEASYTIPLTVDALVKDTDVTPPPVDHPNVEIPRPTAVRPVKAGTRVILGAAFAITDSDGDTWVPGRGDEQGQARGGEFVQGDGRGVGGSVIVAAILDTAGTDLIGNRTVWDPMDEGATFPAPGGYQVRLHITDPTGAEAIYTVPITVVDEGTPE